MGLLLSVGMVGKVSGQAVAAPVVVNIGAGVPLHLRVTETAALRVGTPVEATLVDPVYVGDRLVVPKGAMVSGVVSGYDRVERGVRARALLNGDVTPMHAPVVEFNRLQMPSGAGVTLRARATVRDAQVVRFAPAAARISLAQQAKTVVRERVQSTKDAFFASGKKDRALRLLYSQLPYHPQRIWAGVGMIAELEGVVGVSVPVEEAPLRASDPVLDGVVVKARLAEGMDSRGAKRGDAVKAVVTEPVWDAEHHLVLSEGAMLDGAVTQTRAARSFGRNGQLRFAFREVRDVEGAAQNAYGTLSAAEGEKGENVTVDKEGNVKAHADRNRFVAPLLLTAALAAGQDDDHHHHGTDGNDAGGQTIASNGFGLVARVLALTVKDRNVSTGFGAFALAKSVYFRFLTRGHDVSFPRDTMVEVTFAQRGGGSPVAGAPGH